MAKIYVGCSLTQAPAEFVRAVEDLKFRIRQFGHEVFDFVGLVAGTHADVYETDIHKCVAECELFLAICDFPAIGLGWEMGVAIEKYRKPTLAVAHTDAKVSRILIGAICERNPHYSFKRYNCLSDIVTLLHEFLEVQRITQ